MLLKFKKKILFYHKLFDVGVFQEGSENVGE